MMETIDVFLPEGVELIQHAGTPPVDQSAEVAALTAQVADLTAQLATVTTERDAANNKIAAARVPAQLTVDALA